MIKTISIPELHEATKTASKDVLILDVRSDEEYREGHIPGARNIAHDCVSGHIEELMPYKTIYVYCHAGGRVQIAAFQLMSAGLRNLVLVVDGGMPDWEDAGFPVEK